MCKATISKNWAPKCVMDGCNNLVSYHKKYSKLNHGGPGFKWMQACPDHRGARKAEFDAWKLKRGCENRDTHHGFACTTTITHPSQIDVNHIDGNKMNTTPSNIECLCRVCHARVTVDSGHQHNRYSNVVDLDPNLFEVI